MQESERLEFIKQFLQDYCAEADEPHEVVNRLELQALVNARPILQAKREIDALLSQNLSDHTILALVTQSARVELESPTHENATAWLKWLAEQLDREINENLLPFQPIRAKLQRSVPPENIHFPHDLRLYPADEPLPEYWQRTWGKEVFYCQFLHEWDGKTCPACQTPTISQAHEKKYTEETPASPCGLRARYDKFIVYRCTNCQCGWTECNGSEAIEDAG